MSEVEVLSYRMRTHTGSLGIPNLWPDAEVAMV